ncbi:flagellar biosynthesis anti-sigma factor FlgM [Pseudoalteromonas sp. NBT06-2]|jgi:negative regulator of flagellin synthesis FlgM|uniref:flagellar biosynthesis anti-sigma factor FlgM n=1 Tax=Pseudoalteromonas sp. NBT06-2 TaxID=2025950 RepID=UPI000BA7279C|nr:flagellar biosynthesis anti-sigma factor FlgM [Pseudoalteromonas sp. NBT06-2]PAJ75149.1 flagellar biosynthesis anti-sigma factor FlgM [Pseudoalteromonas sp. NBT06-2]
MVNQVNKGNQQNVTYTNSKQQQLSVNKDNAATAVQNQPTASTKAAKDSVNLTPQAQQLRGLHEKAEQSSGFDSKKVSELKKVISEGNYQVNAEKLAEKIAGFEFDLYGKYND